MSMFKKIKGLFVVEDEDQKKKEVSKSDEELTQDIKTIEDQTTENIETTYEPQPQSHTNTQIDDESRKKFINIFLKALDDNNQQGFDYLEFKNALQNLSNMNMDDATKYQSALAMAKTMNVSVADIVNSASKYLQVLKSEEQKFLVVVQKQKKIKVTDAEAALENKKKQIEARKKQIIELQKQIDQAEASLESEKQKIIAEGNKVQATYNNFKSAYQAITEQIIKDVDNIKQYVK